MCFLLLVGFHKVYCWEIVIYVYIFYTSFVVCFACEYKNIMKAFLFQLFSNWQWKIWSVKFKIINKNQSNLVFSIWKKLTCENCLLPGNFQTFKESFPLNWLTNSTAHPGHLTLNVQFPVNIYKDFSTQNSTVEGPFCVKVAITSNKNP